MYPFDQQQKIKLYILGVPMNKLGK